MSEWVSVKERLPEYGQRVLVWLDESPRLPSGEHMLIMDNHCFATWYAPFDEFESPMWCVEGVEEEHFFAQSDIKIAHWMPLPEGPK